MKCSIRYCRQKKAIKMVVNIDIVYGGLEFPPPFKQTAHICHHHIAIFSAARLKGKEVCFLKNAKSDRILYCLTGGQDD